jgi:hypothetical protein
MVRRRLLALMVRCLPKLTVRRRLLALMVRPRPALTRLRLPTLSWRLAVTGDSEGSGSKV